MRPPKRGSVSWTGKRLCWYYIQSYMFSCMLYNLYVDLTFEFYFIKLKSLFTKFLKPSVDSIDWAFATSILISHSCQIYWFFALKIFLIHVWIIGCVYQLQNRSTVVSRMMHLKINWTVPRPSRTHPAQRISVLVPKCFEIDLCA